VSEEQLLRRAAEARASVERSQDYLAQRLHSTDQEQRAALKALAIREMVSARELLWFLIGDLERGQQQEEEEENHT
jgi:hypothetical protein